MTATWNWYSTPNITTNYFTHAECPSPSWLQIIVLFFLYLIAFIKNEKTRTKTETETNTKYNRTMDNSAAKGLLLFLLPYKERKTNAFHCFETILNWMLGIKMLRKWKNKNANDWLDSLENTHARVCTVGESAAIHRKHYDNFNCEFILTEWWNFERKCKWALFSFRFSRNAFYFNFISTDIKKVIPQVSFYAET